MIRGILSLAVGLLLLALARPADAGVCYTWDCDETTRVCQFDASCTNLGTTIMYWSWDFGDGSSFLSYTSPQAVHGYDYRNWEHVTLTVHYWWDSSIGCDIIIWNTVGPPVATFGTCS
jgi:hypothetical protein